MKKGSGKKKKKDVTLDDLAAMTQKGFEAVDKRFYEVDKRFDAVDKRFDEVDRKLDIIENKLIARHEREIEHLRDKVLRIETKLAKMK